MEFLTWGAIIAASGSLIAVIKFWQDQGRAQQRADDAIEAARLAAAANSLMTQKLNDFRVDAAQTYATRSALAEAESQLARGIETAVQGIFSRLDTLNTRIDTLINITKQPH